jgi:hypothetical protein
MLKDLDTRRKKFAPKNFNPSSKKGLQNYLDEWNMQLADSGSLWDIL